MQLKYGKVKFGYKDSWSAEPILPEIIADWLTNFRKVLVDKQDNDFIGCPHRVMITVYPNKTDFNYTDEQVKQGLVKWIEMIDTMIYAFRNEEPDHEFKWVDGPEHNRVDDRGLIRWNKIPDDESAYNVWKEQCEQHRQKVELGRKLFAEYYDNLWW